MGGRNWGDRGDWSVVRSMKRKTTQPEDRRQDISRVSKRHGGKEQVQVVDRRYREDA